MEQIVRQRQIVAAIRSQICTSQYSAAAFDLEVYRHEFGPNDLYRRLRGEIDYARHAAEAYRDAYKRMRAR